MCPFESRQPCQWASHFRSVVLIFYLKYGRANGGRRLGGRWKSSIDVTPLKTLSGLIHRLSITDNVHILVILLDFLPHPHHQTSVKRSSPKSTDCALLPEVVFLCFEGFWMRRPITSSCRLLCSSFNKGRINVSGTLFSGNAASHRRATVYVVRTKKQAGCFIVFVKWRKSQNCKKKKKVMFYYLMCLK